MMATCEELQYLGFDLDNIIDIFGFNEYCFVNGCPTDEHFCVNVDKFLKIIEEEKNDYRIQ